MLPPPEDEEWPPGMPEGPRWSKAVPSKLSFTLSISFNKKFVSP